MRRSAGILLWRRGNGGIEVLLAHPGGPYFARKDDAHWTIPKGECEPGEDEWAAAQREFAEELGILTPDGPVVSLGEARQQNAKVNVIWAVEADPGPFELRSNSFEIPWPPRSGKTASFPEVDQVAWFDLPAARRKLFSSQLPFLDRLEAAAQKPGQAGTDARGRPSR